MQLTPHPAAYIIPHHAVTKSSSSTTKLRVVFDASAQSTTQCSLNEQLLVGPKLQRDITELISSFRVHRIAICADIKQMYRQIWIAPEHRKYQHILWRTSPRLPVQEYELNTVTYGISSSAYLAQRVLLQLVEDEGAPFPLASRALRRHTYVDDVVSGADCLEDALKLRGELVHLLALGGFSLRKWSSNSPQLLADVPTELHQQPLSLSASDDSIYKILGLQWDSLSDSFSYSVSPQSDPPTKRTVLSHLARIFDPMGWLSPTVFWAKRLIQSLWKCGIGWDDPLQAEFLSERESFLHQLPALSEIRIPRHVPQSVGSSPILVGFCDASEKGYAAVAYLITYTARSHTSVHLLKGKSKVAPLKTLSIPRLELCAALLLSRLITSLKDTLDRFQPSRIFLFSDSSVVLSWLRTPPHLLKTFVANRVVEILDSTSDASWHHIPTEHNPADAASRGLLPESLLSHSLWWQGPSFLLLNPSTWNLPSSSLPHTELPELKIPAEVLTATRREVNPLVEHISRFSSLIRLQRTFAFILRFVHNCRHDRRLSGPLSASEMRHSILTLVSLTQKEYFSETILLIQSSSPPTNSLRSLAPFLDPLGFLRVGGRLRHSELNEAAKYPLLLPKRGHLSALLCDHYHQVSLHAGPRAVQALIQRRYWIISLRGLLRHRIFKCLTCFKLQTKPKAPLMADLPAVRLTPARAFQRVGIDYAGPFLVKESNRRNARSTKGYLCLFVCMVTKAIHLELVSDLTTQAFLAALDRFMARRGLCSDIYSDHGTNFVGASRYLQSLFSSLRKGQHQITDYLSTREITWHFIPPSAPNFGGLWEAGVKSAKHHIRRVIGDRPLTFEELSTLFARVEAVLNSRPLCAVSNDPHDSPSDYLSPGHFLIGAPLLSVPYKDLTPLPTNHLSRWQVLRQALQSFWKRWSAEYLNSLTQRTKWATPQRGVAVGDLVFLSDPQSPPLRWPLGRVEDVRPGPDGIPRVAVVRTSTGSFLRPVNRLVPLPYS